MDAALGLRPVVVGVLRERVRAVAAHKTAPELYCDQPAGSDRGAI